MKRIILPLFIFLNIICAAQNNVPEWAKGIVWYQIFPERFRNGDPSNDPDADKVFINSYRKPADWQISRWTSNWFEMSPWEKKLGEKPGYHFYERRYGGDLQGIIDKLDYLKELGIGAIYLNPIFEAVSLHKYDGSTYHHIDVNFGTKPADDYQKIYSETPDDPRTWQWTSADSLFLKLIDEVHKRGMKIIIDGVFNHTGVQFWAFQDLVKNQENSKYKEWYHVNSFDDPATPKNEFDYKGWWNVKSLPEFDKDQNDIHLGPKQYIFHSTKRWMDPDNDGDPSDGIDGWRLDVARELPLGFWKDWNALVKTINPNALIVGELWELSPDFISENGVFDALMNYNFAYAVNDFIVADKRKITASGFVDSLLKVDKSYPLENLNVLQNLIDSHDTERLSSLIKNPDRKYDRDANEGNKKYDPSKPTPDNYKTQKLIAALQMTYRGAPMIYYGDEVGMWGADDPHCRKPMIWSDLKYDNEIINSSSGFAKGYGSYKVEPNNDLFDFYKKIIAIRNNSLALQTGDLNFLYSNDEQRTFVFERNSGREKVVAAFNLSDKKTEFAVSLGIKSASYKELIEGEEGMVSAFDENAKLAIVLNPGTFKIYKMFKAE